MHASKIRNDPPPPHTHTYKLGVLVILSRRYMNNSNTALIKRCALWSHFSQIKCTLCTALILSERFLVVTMALNIAQEVSLLHNFENRLVISYFQKVL